MFIMYVDESGDMGAMPANPALKGNDQPVLTIGSLLIDVRRDAFLVQAVI